VRDISEEIGAFGKPPKPSKSDENPYALKEFDVSSLKEQFENFEFDLGGDKEEDEDDDD